MSDPKGDRPETPDAADGTAGDDLTTAPPSSTGSDEDATDAASADVVEGPHVADNKADDGTDGAEDGTASEASSAPTAPTGDDPSDDTAQGEDVQDDAPTGGDTAGDATESDVEAPPGMEASREDDDLGDRNAPEAEPLAEAAEPAHLAPGHDDPVIPSSERAHPAHPAHAVSTDADPDRPTSARATAESEPSAPPVAEEDSGPASGPGGAVPSEPGGWRRLGAALRPRASRSQVLAGVLCAALGFALVVQVQQSASDQLSSARQEDLVRLLDEVTDRAQQLGDEVSGLEATRDELESGSGQARSALELAEQRAESEGILSGRLPAQGPGVRITIQDPEGALKASQMFNVLEELRNAGAEVVELNGVRLVTSTWFEDDRAAIVVDGTALSSPYEWTVIGDPETMDRALEIPGGALATVRTAGAEASTAREDEVTITAVTPPQEPEYAEPERQGD